MLVIWLIEMYYTLIITIRIYLNVDRKLQNYYWCLNNDEYLLIKSVSKY